MIEGTLKDASLPGLLQFLATENNELYRLTLTAGSNSGEIFVSRGFVISATFNLLNGVDALCELLNWREGSFSVERLALEFQATIKKNINLKLELPNTFVSQYAFLCESVVGLNTLIVPSKKFGSLEWQDALRTQPLEREDFVLMGWLKEGRTMRQACREFDFDIVKATSILYRLLLTHSVEPLRSGAIARQRSSNDDGNQLSHGAVRNVPLNLADLRASMESRLKLRRQPESARDEAGHRATREQSSQPEAAQVAKPRAGAHLAPSLVPAVGAPGADGVVGLTIVGDNKYHQSDSNFNAKAVTEGNSPITNSTINCAPEQVDSIVDINSATASEFLSKKTEAMPIITIDIERLLQGMFSTTQFGKAALSNPALDIHLRQTLLDVEAGKSVLLALNTANRSAASVLSTFRFCLARGYISSFDHVIPLTADLLLGRMELDQYLLQRRRINGDELRDLIEVEKQKGIKLTELLLRHGHLTLGDLERLTIEQKRFALT
jgi:hypothetical protein